MNSGDFVKQIRCIHINFTARAYATTPENQYCCTVDLKSGHPYFLMKDGLYLYEQLSCCYQTDVAILGGGISGALMAHQLMKNNISCAVVDARNVGLGSTCASTSLLQYEIDISLCELAGKIGEKNALMAYKICSECIDKLQEVAKETGFKDFQLCESLYFAHHSDKNKKLEEEYACRKKAGFDVTLLDKKEIENKFGMRAPMAILSKKAAKTDAYLLTHFIYRHNIPQGLKVFEHTKIKDIQHARNSVLLTAENGFTIKAKKIVFATGYEVVSMIRKPIVKLRSTYAFASKPVEKLPEHFSKTLMWNTANPYLYIREDAGRVMVGGRDINFYNPSKRDRALKYKIIQLKNDFKKLYPSLDGMIEPQYAWAGTFGSTEDGLPYIGSYSQVPNSYFALGFGGNGITFSALAAELITDSIQKKSKSQVPQIFSFDR